jgi:hypothetical protein
MRFEWDQKKSQRCFDARGFDFEYVIASLFDPNRLVMQDHRYDYGEDRFQCYGMIDGRLFFVVYTLRNSVVRIISARKANQREVTQYEISTNKDR